MIGITHVQRIAPRRATGVALACAVLMSLTACGGEERSEQAASQPDEVSVLLPFSRSIAFWPVHVADELGYFDEEGIDIADEATDGSSFVVQQVSAGNAPYGIAVTEPAILGYAQNPSFVSVYEFLTGNAFNVWVRDDSPIQSIADFNPGDTIAIKDQAGGDIPRLNVALEKSGLTPGTDVTYTQFGDNTAIAADLLIKNEVDGLEVSWNSLVGIEVALEKAGVKLRCITCTEEQQYAAESLLVSNEYLDQNRGLVEGFGRALAKATLFGITNPDAAIDIMKRINPEEQTDPEYTKRYFGDAIELMTPRKPENKYGWQDVAAYQRSMDLLLDPNLAEGLAKPIDLQKFVDNGLVDAFNDFDHAAVEQQAKNWTP
jgi:NitT/TauT family transport system substrate-binding protein